MFDIGCNDRMNGLQASFARRDSALRQSELLIFWAENMNVNGYSLILAMKSFIDLILNLSTM